MAFYQNSRGVSLTHYFILGVSFYVLRGSCGFLDATFSRTQDVRVSAPLTPRPHVTKRANTIQSSQKRFPSIPVKLYGSDRMASRLTPLFPLFVHPAVRACDNKHSRLDFATQPPGPQHPLSDNCVSTVVCSLSKAPSDSRLRIQLMLFYLGSTGSFCQKELQRKLVPTVRFL